MTLWLETAFAKYGWIWIGLTFGFAAKYALLIKRGVPLRPSLIIADILLLPMIALIAHAIVSRFGAAGETAALLSALATVTGDRLIKLATERFFRGVQTEAEMASERLRGIVTNDVQRELSSKELINDQLSGKAPAEYTALKRRPRKP